MGVCDWTEIRAPQSTHKCIVLKGKLELCESIALDFTLCDAAFTGIHGGFTGIHESSRELDPDWQGVQVRRWGPGAAAAETT